MTKSQFLVIALYILIPGRVCGLNPCVSKTFPGVDSNVCVCNATYCDEIPPLPSLNNNQAATYVSSKSGKRFELNTVQFSSDASSNSIKITIDPSKTYQEIIGFGGAFTGSAGYEIMEHLKEPAAQDNLIKSYFGEAGIGYTLGRVPIATSDFSLSKDSYDDIANGTDFNLDHFKLLPEDIQYKIPVIQKALNLTKNQLKLFGSPWSAPGWMKNNSDTTQGGSLLGNASDPNDKIHQTYANYFVKFFESYFQNNIPFWGVTIQNEPLLWAYYQSMIMEATEQRDFIKNFFGPTIRSNNLTKDLKIMIWDFNRGSPRDYIDTVLSDLNASSYVDGIGMHWYDDFGWFGNRSTSDVLNNIHDSHMDKWILSTEGCTFYFPKKNEHAPDVGNWYHGEFYAIDIIDDLNHWTVGWVDWNMVLNTTGGPYWNQSLYGNNSIKDPGRTIDAPVIISDDGSEFYKQPGYYLLGHFSKFIVPNSIRIGIDLNQTIDSSVQGLSVLTPNKQIVVVLYNYDNNTDFNVSLQVSGGMNWININLEPKSITTLIWNQESSTTQTPTTTPKLASHLSVNILLCVFAVLIGFYC